MQKTADFPVQLTLSSILLVTFISGVSQPYFGAKWAFYVFIVLLSFAHLLALSSARARLRNYFRSLAQDHFIIKGFADRALFQGIVIGGALALAIWALICWFVVGAVLVLFFNIFFVSAFSDNSQPLAVRGSIAGLLVILTIASAGVFFWSFRCLVNFFYGIWNSPMSVRHETAFTKNLEGIARGNFQLFQAGLAESAVEVNIPESKEKVVYLVYSRVLLSFWECKPLIVFVVAPESRKIAKAFNQPLFLTASVC